MAKENPPTKPQPSQENEKVPFDEALRRLVNAPPQHKPAKKPVKNAPRKEPKG